MDRRKSSKQDRKDGAVSPARKGRGAARPDQDATPATHGMAWKQQQQHGRREARRRRRRGEREGGRRRRRQRAAGGRGQESAAAGSVAVMHARTHICTHALSVDASHFISPSRLRLHLLSIRRRRRRGMLFIYFCVLWVRICRQTPPPPRTRHRLFLFRLKLGWGGVGKSHISGQSFFCLNGESDVARFRRSESNRRTDASGPD